MLTIIPGTQAIGIAMFKIGIKGAVSGYIIGGVIGGLAALATGECVADGIARGAINGAMNGFIAGAIMGAGKAIAVKKAVKAANAAKAKSFTSMTDDGLTGRVANAIEGTYKGSVKGIDRVIKVGGKRITDIDIEMKRIVIQVKGGKNLRGLEEQLNLSAKYTGKYAIAYAPKATPAMINHYASVQQMIFTNSNDLIIFLGFFI